jgi:hypothetical protein
MIETSTFQRQIARLAGCSLLLMAALAAIGYGYIFQHIYIPHDGTATLSNLKSQQPAFRLFVLLFVIILVLDVVVAWGIYIFFSPAHRPLALLTAWLRLAYWALLGVSFTGLVPALHPGEDSAALPGLQHFTDLWSLALIVFGCHLLLLGSLVLKAHLWRIVGLLIIIASVGYLTTNMLSLLWPDYMQYKKNIEAVLSLPMALGELSFAVLLLVKPGKRG